MRPNAPTAVLGALFLVLTGCPVRVPLDYGALGEPKGVDDLLTRIDMAELSVVSIKGDAKIKVKLDEKGGSTGAFVAVQDPASIHLEILDFFGRPQTVLSTDGKTFGLFDGQQGRFFTGPATAANLRRALPVTLPPGELAALLLGRVPRLSGARSSMTFDSDRNLFVVVLEAPEGRQTLEVSPPSYRVVRSSLSTPRSYEVSFSQLDQISGFVVARHAVLDAPGAHLELSYKDIEINSGIEPSLFAPTAPENVPQIRLDDQGGSVR